MVKAPDTLPFIYLSPACVIIVTKVVIKWFIVGLWLQFPIGRDIGDWSALGFGLCTSNTRRNLHVRAVRRKDYKALAGSHLHKQRWVKKTKLKWPLKPWTPQRGGSLLLRAKISFFVVVPNKITGAGKHTEPRSTSLGSTRERCIHTGLTRHVTG